MKYYGLILVNIGLTTGVWTLIDDEGLKWMLITVIQLLFMIIVVVASMNIRWNVFLKSVNRLQGRKLAITFDDGPHPEHTGQILDLLKSHSVKATFFVVGNKVKDGETLLKRMIEDGHTVGNHSYTHTNRHGFLRTGQVEKEIRWTNKVIQEATGEPVRLYRPPVGVTNPNIARAVKRCKMVSIGWDIRSLDTRIDDVDLLWDRIQKKLRAGGSILLLHDTCKVTVEVLPRVLQYCKDNGIEIVDLKDEVAHV